MEAKIAILAGDGIGPEVMEQAIRVLDAVASKFSHNFSYTEGLVGGAAWDSHQSHFPEETKEICLKSDAILFGSVGGPMDERHLDKWKGCEANSILALRKTFSFNANFRPAKIYKELIDKCPLRADIVENGADLLVVRELLGDIYFGEHSRREENGETIAKDVAEYSVSQIKSVAHSAFQAAQKRRKKLTSVDKANVLETSRLWREVVEEVHKEYSDVSLEHMFVDNAAMQIVLDPAQFDVILTGNIFGDILSDTAAVLPGSLGLTPSASLNKDGFAMYEPSGGSAPDIAGKGVANPIAQILSAAMMLKFSFSLIEESEAIEAAVDQVLSKGLRTGDIHSEPNKLVGTSEFTNAVIAEI